MTQDLLNLTARDREILETLTLRVRVLSLSQIADRWFSNSKGASAVAVRRLRVMEAAGFIHLGTRASRPLPPLQHPLAAWNPGKEVPDFQDLARVAVRRWKEPAVYVPIAIASKRAGIRFGGNGGQWPRDSEVSHDLALGSLYLQRFYPERDVARTWISEARLRSEGFGVDTRLPDARCDRGGRRVFIELVGEYRPEKLSDFHQFCVEHGTGYEFW